MFRFINIDGFSLAFLPKSLQKSNITDFFNSLLAVFFPALSDYLTFRKLTILQANTTGQVIVLENFLNTLFDPAQKRIYILNTPPSSTAPQVAYSYEATNLYLEIGYEAEGSFYAAIPNESEAPTYGYSFVVMYPAGIDTARLQKVVDAYKQAGKTYTIQQI